MADVYVLIGGNLGDRFSQLAKARDLINSIEASVKQVSSLYETAAWGMTEQPAFLNQALLVTTDLEPHYLLHELLSIENSIGRKRSQKFGPRIIDIDILLYGQLVVQTTDLVIPHPELQNRRFALAPLNEIAEGIVHPVLNKSISQLLAECPDSLEVKKLSGAL